MRLSRHVGLERLERVVHDEAGARERHRVLRHLESCAGCRARLHFIRSLPDRLEAATRPPLPESLIDRILDDREAGERVILPVRARASERPGRRVVRGIAAAGLVLAASAVAWLTLRGTAEANLVGGDLTFEPAEPGPGDRIEIAYRPGRLLEGEPSLVLRGIVSPPARYHRARPSPRRLAVLERVGREYRGSFAFEPGDVYAQLVVEDADGSVVDDRGGMSWHLHTHDADGRPSRDALWARALLASSDQWSEGYDAIRRATELYPADPRLRASLLSFELAIFTRAERDSALAAHRADFEAIAGTLTRRESLEPETLAGLIEYARTVGDTAAAERWVERLVDVYPSHPEAVWYRVPEPPADSSPAALARYLEELESLWRDAGPHPALPSAGLWAARRAGDAVRILAWAERLAGHPGWTTERPETGLVLARVPELRDAAIERLRDEIERLDEGDTDRPLGRTVAEHRRENRDTLRPLLVGLSEALLAGGERSAALDSLRVAASIGWSRVVFARLAAVELAGGDTLAAATSLARAAVVRFAPAAEEGLDPALGPRLVSADEWEVLRRSARDEMHRRLLARSIDRPLRADQVHVFDSGGTRFQLDDLRHRTVTMVAFWEPRSAPAVRALSELRRVTYLLRAMGAEVVVVTRAAPSPRLDTILAEREVDLPLYHDLDRRATEAFQTTVTPEYYVLDFDGRVRFADSPLEDVLPQVDALLDEPRLEAVAARAPAGG